MRDKCDESCAIQVLEKETLGNFLEHLAFFLSGIEMHELCYSWRISGMQLQIAEFMLSCVLL
jgi:hypothetical protein